MEKLRKNIVQFIEIFPSSVESPFFIQELNSKDILKIVISFIILLNKCPKDFQLYLIFWESEIRHKKRFFVLLSSVKRRHILWIMRVESEQFVIWLMLFYFFSPFNSIRLFRQYIVVIAVVTKCWFILHFWNL